MHTKRKAMTPVRRYASPARRGRPLKAPVHRGGGAVAANFALAVFTPRVAAWYQELQPHPCTCAGSEGESRHGDGSTRPCLRAPVHACVCTSMRACQDRATHSSTSAHAAPPIREALRSEQPSDQSATPIRAALRSEAVSDQRSPPIRVAL